MIIRLEEEFQIFLSERKQTELHYKGLVLHIYSNPYRLIDLGDVYAQKPIRLNENGFVGENGIELAFDEELDQDGLDGVRLISKCFTKVSYQFYQNQYDFKSLRESNNCYARKWKDQEIGVLSESGYWVLCRRDTGEWFLWEYEPNGL